MKISLKEISRLDTAEEMISQLEDIAIESIPNETERRENDRKNKGTDPHWSMVQYQVF